jgi:hypothetical protein
VHGGKMADIIINIIAYLLAGVVILLLIVVVSYLLSVLAELGETVVCGIKTRQYNISQRKKDESLPLNSAGRRSDGV